VTGRRPEPLEGVAADIDAAGGEAVAFPCDVTREADVERLVRHVRATLGDPEIAVHAAGAGAAVRQVRNG
jgi:NAD(P)-dependent dehydrogenase (short-subunit alcohol dehydrogenase family)